MVEDLIAELDDALASYGDDVVLRRAIVRGPLTPSGFTTSTCAERNRLMSRWSPSTTTPTADQPPTPTSNGSATATTASRAAADSANHHPDVDLRYPSVTVRLTTHEIHGLSDRDASLAREISSLAREMDIRTEPIERE